ncbi:MAG TPA: efflux RND transporter permease subunit [Terriglobales bacterium]|nr:efflux RND transporter permease subunit [Terriglobales bacterium]
MTGLFIRRPIMTTLVMAAIVVFGIFAYRVLPVSDLPNVDFPTIQVNASLPGASPETMASSVATPLEKQFTTIAGISQMTSTSQLGSTSITIQFDLSRKLDGAAVDVQSAIAAAGGQLPPNLPTPPTFKKVNPADSPILYIALSSTTLPIYSVDEAAETTIGQQLSMIQGVAQVQVFGAAKYAVRVDADPNKLASMQIGINDLAQAIQSGNTNLPVGSIYAPDKTYTLQSNGHLASADQFRPLIVAYRNGAPVRLEQLANVFDGVQDAYAKSWFNNQRAVVLAVQKQPGTNTIEIVNAINSLMPRLKQQIPTAITVQTLYDRSVSIRNSVNDVKFTLLLTIALVVMVIFLFLRNISATIIPSLALPMSIIGTFMVMYVLGYTVDNLSLMSLTLSVGFVVDDAIVMLENIVRHMEMGKKPMQAAFDGASEIGFTVLSMTLSLTAVFIPILFMGGIVGRLLHEFAVVIMAAILVSGFVSLTLTPMLGSRFLRAPSETTHGRLYNASERVFDGMLHFYRWTLKRALKWKFVTLMLSFGVIALTVFLFMISKTGFIPNEDEGLVFGFIQAPEGIGFDEMGQKVQQIAGIVESDPAVLYTMASYGNPVNQGRVFFHLKDVKDRPHQMSANDLIAEMRPKMAQVQGVMVFMQVPPTTNVGGRLTNAQYQYTLQSPDTAELYADAPKMQAELRKLPILRDVNTDLQIHNPQLTLKVDRNKAYTLGLTAQQVSDALYSAFGQRQVSTIYTPNNEYYVILELSPEYRSNPQTLSMLYVRADDGKLIPLNTVASVVPGMGPLTVNHLGQLPAVTLSFNLKDGVALGDATKAVEQVAEKTLPATVQRSFQGTAHAFQQSFAGLGFLLLAAIAVIYIVLGILYESFIHPLTILSGLPSAAVGALATLLIFHEELNLYSFVGIIMLIGIVKKNAIMMIDFALENERTRGESPEESIYQGALVRFRPIMMTTMAALMGTLPIAIGFGAGAEARRGLGLAVVGGLIFSQMVTLYITPVYYVYLDRVQNHMNNFWTRLTGRAAKAKALPVTEKAELVER